VKAIIVAAGRGRRLGPETAEIPKCMVAVGGRAILHRQLDALAAAGVDDVVIVRGYLGDKIHPPANFAANSGRSLRFVENPEWASNNILASLMYAESEMAGGFLFSYSDIVFAPEHVRRLVAAGDDVGLVVDRRWDKAYVGRIQHPVSEAELAKVEGAGPGARVSRVGKRVVAAADAAGEFIGLARFSDPGARALRDAWHAALALGLDRPFGTAASLRNAYLSDALNAMADDGVRLSPLLIDGRWREIDTQEDLARANPVVDTWG
jgi:choline kinase